MVSFKAPFSASSANAGSVFPCTEVGLDDHEPHRCLSSLITDHSLSEEKMSPKISLNCQQ